jgi:two-component system, NarL family, nitrate/nitrite response regulator NarL
MDKGRIRIGILEDQQIFLESLVALFEGAGMEVLVRGQNVQGFLSQLGETAPDVALVDLRLERSDSAEVGDGLELVEALRQHHPHTRTLVLSAHHEAPVLERCFRAGAAGYLCKLDVSGAGLVSAVEQVARGERLVPVEFASPPSDTADRPAFLVSRLTAREREVLGLVASGADNLKISARLGITERTVKAHVSNLYRKLEVDNRVEMAVVAYQAGLQRPPRELSA